MSARPRLLDLFCGAGGAAMGYYRAGFEVVGVDIKPQPRYPFDFIQGDALNPPVNLSAFDAIHASPPCQHYSSISRCSPGLSEQYPDLIDPVRKMLVSTCKPFVIENVPEAPLENPVTFCGSMFKLETNWQGQTYGLRRHRAFESPIRLQSLSCLHKKGVLSIGVYGNGAGGGRPRSVKGSGFEQARRDVMQIDWMRREELNESIPPAYTEFIGLQLIAQL